MQANIEVTGKGRQGLGRTFAILVAVALGVLALIVFELNAASRQAAVPTRDSSLSQAAVSTSSPAGDAPAVFT